VARISDRLSLRALLYWLTAAGLLVILIISLIVGLRTRQVSSEADRVVDVYEPAAEDVAALSLATSDMQRGLSTYVLGGGEKDLRPFVDGERRSDLALSDLQRLLGDTPEAQPLITEAEASREQWLDGIARPAIKAMRGGEVVRARQLVVGDLSQELYDQLVTDTDKLRHTLNSARASGFEELNDLTGRLSTVVIIAIVGLVLALLLAGGLLFRWILGPLNDLRRQLREVARRGNHEHPITPSGPLEMAAAGKDAEAMRRQLVTEIDEAQSAREALEHRAPLVTAIRRELSMATDPVIRGVRVHGEVRAAEGVLAGDWWDCVAMPSGEAALIITDIAGHGPEAGVAAMRIKHLMALLLASGASPDESLQLAARTFADEVGRFATVAVVCVDPATGIVRWANGGHHPPLIVHPEGTYEELDRTGPLLSWLGGPWQSRTTAMTDEDVLLAFSDGLIESHSAEGQELALSGLLEIFAETSQGPAPVPEEELVRGTLARARERAIDWERDDVTLVALKLKDLATEDRSGQPVTMAAAIPLPRPEEPQTD
jgi:serine phosphatase RsbU (regulator of sigma subunit)/CHASE3 domain sensor protein